MPFWNLASLVTLALCLCGGGGRGSGRWGRFLFVVVVVVAILLMLFFVFKVAADAVHRLFADGLRPCFPAATSSSSSRTENSGGASDELVEMPHLQFSKVEHVPVDLRDKLQQLIVMMRSGVETLIVYDEGLGDKDDLLHKFSAADETHEVAEGGERL